MDHGVTWIGVGTDPAGSTLASGYSPEIDVSADGTIYVASLGDNAINMIVSTDGGDSFQPVTSPAISITTLQASLPPWKPGGWPVLPGGIFRVFTFPTACSVGPTVFVAWADYREGASRIYYAQSNDARSTWETGPSGQPLLTGTFPANFQHFHPQIVIAPNGVVGCTFYEFGPKPTKYLIDVIMSQSFDNGRRSTALQ